MSLRDKLFSFDGRLRRRDYWAVSIGMGICLWLVTEITFRAIMGSDYSIFSGGLAAYTLRQTGGALLLQAAMSLLTIWPVLALTIKRAHDRDNGAGLVIGLLLTSYVTSYLPPFLMTALGSASMLAGVVASLISVGVSLYLFVVLGCLDGTPGPNRFGPSPKGPGVDASEVFS